MGVRVPLPAQANQPCSFSAGFLFACAGTPAFISDPFPNPSLREGLCSRQLLLNQPCSFSAGFLFACAGTPAFISDPFPNPSLREGLCSRQLLLNQPCSFSA
ncbi:MAG: hypothetical protein M0Q12_02930, partial [Synergistaceae bacterium]|nr:hypothetical protein [Synergistaceae bacterium]